MGLSKWPVEDIPGVDRIYMRVHFRQVDAGNPMPGAFSDHEGGMSTDWEKYSTPDETQLRGKQAPNLYGVIGLVVGSVRKIPGLGVVHEPIDDNRAHTEVFGKKDPQTRLQLLRSFQWIIPLP